MTEPSNPRPIYTIGLKRVLEYFGLWDGRVAKLKERMPWPGIDSLPVLPRSPFVVADPLAVYEFKSIEHDDRVLEVFIVKPAGNTLEDGFFTQRFLVRVEPLTLKAEVCEQVTHSLRGTVAGTPDLHREVAHAVGGLVQALKRGAT